MSTAPTLDSILRAALQLVIYIGIPFWFVFAPALARWCRFIPQRKLGRGILLSTLIMWPLMIFYHAGVEVPRMIESSNNPLHDGAGNNVAMLLFGWLVALIAAVPHIVLRVLLGFLMRSKQD